MSKIKNVLKTGNQICFLLFCCIVTAQSSNSVTLSDTVNEPKLVFDKLEHDFGDVGEHDGYAQHIFSFTNTGNAPLIITNASASCGCTRPEWPQQPIKPGERGGIIIMYNPAGRPGSFHKTATVYTNEEGGFKRHRLDIKGVVVEKPRDPMATYLDTVGGIGIERKNLIFREFKNTQINKEIKYIKNFTDKTLHLKYEVDTTFMSVQSPDSLRADWHSEVTVLIDGTKTGNKRGRYHEQVKWTVSDSAGNVLGADFITATVNYLDNFDELSPLQTANAPTLDIENTQLKFGIVKKGFLGLFGVKTVKQFIISNKGKSELVLHSVTSDVPYVRLPDLKGKTLKPGETLSVSVTIKAKELPADIDIDLFVVSNDPKGPVRRVRVVAQKEN
ncbi:MAG: DUF1573 domain-containing protein [Tannerella sp.]|jgi:hypothetical protein|nr:DUF1573 domain-containing protein [Tannerella sp.]